MTVDLLKTTAQNLGYFGIDTLLNFENIVGSNAADKLYGTNGANILSGSAGNDLIDGRAGDDSINGDQGADIIIGGAGKDTMLGGPDIAAARDTFRYLALTDSTASTATSDIIQLFDTGVTATDDRIDLSAIDTNAAMAGDQGFVWRNTLAFTTSSAWEVRLQVSGADTIVQVDNDSDTAAEMVILVQGVTGLTSWISFSDRKRRSKTKTAGVISGRFDFDLPSDLLSARHGDRRRTGPALQLVEHTAAALAIGRCRSCRCGARCCWCAGRGCGRRLGSIEG